MYIYILYIYIYIVYIYIYIYITVFISVLMVDHDDIVWVVFACGQTVVIMTPLECYLFHCY